MIQKYKILRVAKEKEDRVVTFKLNRHAKFAGIVIDVLKVTFGTEENPEFQVQYEIKRVPKGKYQDLDNSAEQEFKAEVKEVLEHLFKNAIDLYKSTHEIKTEAETIIEDECQTELKQ